LSFADIQVRWLIIILELFMRWRGNRKSSNVDDRRSMGYSGLGRSGGSGLLRLLPLVYRMLGFKGTAVVVLCIGGYGLYTGNLNGVLGLQQASPTTASTKDLKQSAEEKELVEFVSVVLADTEDTWKNIFQQEGRGAYEEPRLVLFRHSVQSACGMAQSATGPFYCPGDRQVYIDLAFFDQLKHRFNAPGDFAQAYVIAHEVGHHVQTLKGISTKVQAARRKLSEVEGNKLSVLQELQADCFSGVWAKHANDTRQLLEVGDVEEGLAAATAIGDDTLQKQARGYVTPDSFTHGSAAQRVKWFKIGLATGDIKQCNTFGNQ
jgi:predicted metalloprotease